MINEAEVHAFLEFPCILYILTNVGNLISGSSSYLKTGLCICTFSIQVLLKPRLKDFEHIVTSVGDVCSCPVV